MDLALARGLLYTLMIIGEAASRVSPAKRARFPALPWQDMIGMRNRLVHADHSVSLEIA